MVLPISEVRRIADRVCARQDVLGACAERDLGYVIAFFEKHGLTQGQMAGLTGLHQNRLSDYKTGKHRPKEYSVFAAFAGGLSLPPAARQALGLDASPAPATTIGVPQPRPASFAEISLDYPGTAGQAAGNVTSLWRADLADQNVLVRAGIDPGAWKDASLRWLVDPVSPPEADLAGGMRVGLGDVERFAVTVEAFRQLDDRFGGGNARPALIQYLGTDADRLLRGRYTGTVGSALFSAVAEATLLAAWPSRTESANTGVASIQVTVTIGCRVAADDRPLGVAAQVDRAVADAVSERVRQWDADGLALEDQLMASYGPAMEVYGRHGRVLNPDGTNADLDRYLNIARRTVRDAMRLRVDELPLETFDATTRFAIFWLRAKGRAQVPKGEARFFAQADELRLDELRGRILSESSAGFRLRLDDPGLVGPGSSTIEVVRAMVHAWEAGGTEAVATVIAAADREPTDQHVWAVVADLARQIPSADKLAQALAGIQRMSNTVSTLVGSARESAAQMSMFGERGELL